MLYEVITGWSLRIAKLRSTPAAYQAEIARQVEEAKRLLGPVV